MCREWNDNEIRADEEAEWLAYQEQAAIEAGPPEPFEPSDKELNAMWDAYMAERMAFETQEDP